MADRIQYACVSHIGRYRGNHEDNFWCDGHFLPENSSGTEDVLTGSVLWQEKPAFGVFDGMGGESCGETAAFLCASTFGEGWEKEKTSSFWNPERTISSLCDSMNQAVLSYGEANHIRTMGSTAVMAFFIGRSVYTANLGDSRAYYFSGEELRQLSVDHVVQDMRYRKPPLVQFLGVPPEELKLVPSVERVKAPSGGLLLLCSDGVTDMLSSREITEVLKDGSDVKNKVETLLKRSLLKGGRDNITILLLEIPVRKTLRNWREHLLDRA